ncbi:BglG family transcription antiterminator [Neobacillus sp. 3P2-tot-E-2]|uniref:BglG family transcription antiterminator n=1 Tax=Neobacillus sp. 3P2-tot-E-2 TaxID=3132212 RepID=UPI0039A3BDB6
MNVTKKEIILLNYFIKNTEYIPLKNIVFDLGVSDKTIRNMIQSLNEVLKEYEAEIVLKRGQGYRLSSNDVEAIQSIIEASEYSSSENNLQELIIQVFIENNTYITIEEMSNRFFISKSKLNKMLINIKSLFDTYGLKIISKPHYGLKLEGDELGKRMALAAYVNETRYIDHSTKSFIERTVIEEIKKEDVVCSDVMLRNLVSQIGIMIKRVEKGYSIVLQHKTEIQVNLEYRLTCAILKRIEDTFDVSFSNAETMYLYSYVIGQITVETQPELNPENPKINIIIDGFLQRIENMYDISLWNDQELREGLLVHLRPLIQRLKSDIHLKNPILNEVKQQFSFAFNLAVLLAEEIYLIYKKILIDDDIAYLSMHVGLALERNVHEVTQKYNRIAIICTTGKGTAQLLKFKIERTFPKANNVKSFSLFNKEEVIDFNPDIIFSTVPVEMDTIPVEIISPFFSENDEKKLMKYQMKKNTELVLAKYFAKDLFSPDLQAQTQRESISKMCDLVGRTGITPANFEELCLRRELLASTCFGNLIALVHPIELCSKVTKVGVGILKKPIDWGGLPVRIIFTIAQAKSNEARDLLLFIQNLVHNQEMIMQLSDVEDFEEFRNVLLKES